jgi:hypothetical protein
MAIKAGLDVEYDDDWITWDSPWEFKPGDNMSSAKLYKYQIKDVWQRLRETETVFILIDKACGAIKFDTYGGIDIYIFKHHLADPYLITHYAELKDRRHIKKYLALVLNEAWKMLDTKRQGYRG